MALLNAGYWPTTYWALNYWNPDYWLHYGTYVPPVVVGGVRPRPVVVKGPALDRDVLEAVQEYLEMKLKNA